MVVLAFIAITVGAAAMVTQSVVLGYVASSAAAAFVALALKTRFGRPVGPNDEQMPDREPAPTAGAPRADADDVRVPASAEPTSLLKSALDHATGQGMEAVAAHLWLADEATSTLRLVSSTGTLRPVGRPLPYDDPVIGRAAATDAAVLEEVATITLRLGETKMWRFAVPVGRSIDAPGVAAIDLLAQSRPDPLALQQIMTPLLPLLSAALMVHVARQQIADAEAVISLGREMSRLVDPEEVLSVTLDRAMDAAGASTGSIMLLDELTGKLRIVRSKGLPPSAVQEASLAPGEGIAGWVYATRQPLLVEDLPDRPNRALRHGVKSAVSVPIADEEDVLGVLNVGSRTFQARFTESHLKTLELLGRQAAIALRNAQAVTKARELFFQTLQALVCALETKDPNAQGSAGRVLEHALAIAREMGVSGDELDALHVAALLHDLGLTALGTDIGSARRPLTTVELGLVKVHPRIAADILAGLPALEAAVPIVYHHHERFDGSGYLDGLSGEDIPLGARILAVADAFVAMTSDRPYRAAMSQSHALAEMRQKAGTQFDPQAVAALERSLRPQSERAPETGAR